MGAPGRGLPVALIAGPRRVLALKRVGGVAALAAGVPEGPGGLHGALSRGAVAPHARGPGRGRGRAVGGVAGPAVSVGRRARVQGVGGGRVAPGAGVGDRGPPAVGRVAREAVTVRGGHPGGGPVFVAVVAGSAGGRGGGSPVGGVAAHAVLVGRRRDLGRGRRLGGVAAAAVLAPGGPGVGTVTARAAAAVDTCGGPGGRGRSWWRAQGRRRMQGPAPRSPGWGRPRGVVPGGRVASGAVGGEGPAGGVGGVAAEAVAVPDGARGHLLGVAARVAAYAVDPAGAGRGVVGPVRVVAASAVGGPVDVGRGHGSGGGARPLPRAGDRPRREGVARHAGRRAPRLGVHGGRGVALPAALACGGARVERSGVAAHARAVPEGPEVPAMLGVGRERTPAGLVAAVTPRAGGLPYAPVVGRGPEAEGGHHEGHPAPFGRGVALLAADASMAWAMGRRGRVTARAERVAPPGPHRSAPEGEGEHREDHGPEGEDPEQDTAGRAHAPRSTRRIFTSRSPRRSPRGPRA